MTTASSASAIPRASFFGPTTLATVSYVCMARTHMQMPQAALLTLATRSGWKSSCSRNASPIFLMTEAGIESLSKVCSDFRKSLSLTMIFDGPQKSSTILPLSSLMRAALTPFMMQTECNTSLTGIGGFPMALISPMSFAVSVSSAVKALASAGIASARSASTSALTAPALAACSAAEASSTATTSLTLFVFTDSSPTWTIIASTSMFLATSFGCSAINSSFMNATDTSVVMILSTPF
mmetsp:Transcript_49835/g.161214  ORF Transcript_49835/g.161214 Transcript_49835/m.161214 type:complete len:238 (+) Transcript_49835:3911-4624(+)